jgi:hypothetical protein
MIFTKKVLVESVVKEMMGEDYQDIEFYKEKAKPFWAAMSQVIQYFKTHPEDIKRWAYEYDVNKRGIVRAPQIFRDNDVLAMVRAWRTDQQIYEKIKAYGIVKENDLIEYAEMMLAKYFKGAGLFDN